MVAQAQTASLTKQRTYTHREILEVMSGLMLAMLTSMISTSVVGTALPTIVGELGGQDQYSWVASATMLTMTVSTPLWGKLSDLFGRKLLFQSALGLFVAASLVAGLSQDMGQLIAARAVQGLGVGGLSALSQVILGDIVSPASVAATPATWEPSSGSPRSRGRCWAGSSWTPTGWAGAGASTWWCRSRWCPSS
ncbi:MFS transporter [Nonomuraea rubra]|uniref:MFS transporter n=1 Tax=Nonomuraea rubra TaxID=46180 RepID=UPI003611F727